MKSIHFNKFYDKKKNKQYVMLGCVLILFLFELFLRFYNFQLLNPFAWDQVDNAWAAKHILIDHAYPLTGMVLKQNSNLTIGPLYYYFVSLFYYVTNLEPIASGIIAGITSVFSFWVLYFVTKKLFSFKVAFIAILINTFSYSAIVFDRVQWPVAFIPSFSILILYFLYKSITESPKYLIWLSICMGLSFHLHFTSIFYPVSVLFFLPFLPRKKETILYLLLGTVILFLFLIPTIITLFQSNYFSNAVTYGGTYYHGFHLRRVLQLIGDAFIQFSSYTTDSLPPFISSQLKNILGISRFLFLPLFTFLYLKKNIQRNTIILTSLFWVWFVVPWVILSTYSGEISDYYFSINKFVCVIILAFLIYKLFEQKLFIWKACVILGLAIYMYINLFLFSHSSREYNLIYYRTQVIQKVKISQPIPFTAGDPASYYYYLYAILKKPY